MNNLGARIFAGGALIYPDFASRDADEMLDETQEFCKYLESFGFITGWNAQVRTTCRAAFLNDSLRKVNAEHWRTYEQEREAGNIPPVAPRGTWSG